MHVQFDGADAELQLFGDFSVGKAFRDQTRDLCLARAERRAHKVFASTRPYGSAESPCRLYDMTNRNGTTFNQVKSGYCTAIN
jgi:hypothetical protein